MQRPLFTTLLAISFLAGSLSTIIAVDIAGGWYEHANLTGQGCAERLDAWLRDGWTQWRLTVDPCALERPRFRPLEWVGNQWERFTWQGPIERLVAPTLLVVLVLLVLLARALWRAGNR